VSLEAERHDREAADVSKVSVGPLSVSLDGYAAGPDQDENNPLGVGGARLHEWIFATRSGRQMIGQSGGEEGVDDDFFKRGAEGVGATIMGRNMFGPVRGPWEETDWRGWWGEEPPFHHPVFVLTHYERADLVMGDTTFHFVTDGAAPALSRALEVAGNQDVHVGGGVATVRDYLRTQLIDELHLAVVSIRLGAGERLVETVGQWPQGYECRAIVPGEGATHYELVRSGIRTPQSP
jgi:dihydrofolate reductase